MYILGNFYQFYFNFYKIQTCFNITPELYIWERHEDDLTFLYSNSTRLAQICSIFNLPRQRFYT